MKFKKETYNIEGNDRVYFYCPGCLAQHRINAEEYAKTMGPITERDLMVMSLHCMNVSTVHRFNGDFDSPTLEPSLMARTGVAWSSCRIAQTGLPGKRLNSRRLRMTPTENSATTEPSLPIRDEMASRGVPLVHAESSA